eukprot:CAMPEP_0174259424 /NCGR_PEP_ID=MMETSP0439-20130205/8244_1 /TAXON_ID=0 /ORGANISM="Stereomyxa ramosa, Strain Chinc5" /LENGTH=535 /DNA_ID=CAMNT_0015343303 /DNA_START=50 /DNA_END=1657 /DNA_ORIENTATION=-
MNKEIVFFFLFGILSGVCFGSHCSDLIAEVEDTFDSERIVFPTDDNYDSVKEQYASLYFDTSPTIILIPESSSEISLALLFAGACDYIVAIRSGGHQYSALSSCDGSYNCLQIDMSLFDSIDYDVEDNLLTVGVGITLSTLYDSLVEFGVFLPTGECGGVGVGGHIQTGGYGRLGRSFGLFLDHVVAFQIVLADGSVENIVAPDDDTTDFNDDLFKAVLGGSPGAWGVITKVVFSPLKDSDYEGSYLYQYRWLYSLEALQNISAAWIELHENDFYVNCANYDLLVTIGCSLLGCSIEVEGIWKNVDESCGETAFNSSIFDKFVGSVTSPVFGVPVEVTADISAFFNDYIIVDLSPYGREINLPVLKMWRMTDSLGDWDSDFNDGMVELMHEQIVTPGAYIVSQWGSLGGFFSYQGGDDSIPFRDSPLGLAWDVFYDTEEISEDDAKDLWQRQVDLVEEHWDVDRRLMWATSFQDVEDGIEALVDYFFDSQEDYEFLIEVKCEVDPDNIFNNSLTVPAINCDSGSSHNSLKPFDLF